MRQEAWRTSKRAISRHPSVLRGSASALCLWAGAGPGANFGINYKTAVLSISAIIIIQLYHGCT